MYSWKGFWDWEVEVWDRVNNKWIEVDVSWIIGGFIQCLEPEWLLELVLDVWVVV